MITLQYKNKSSLFKLRSIIRHACEELGVRLGQGHQKPEFIASKILGVGNFNQALGMMNDPVESRTVNQADIDTMNQMNSNTSVFDINMLSDLSPRTLLYGYHCDLDGKGSDTLHVYLDNKGLLHALTYNYDEETISHHVGTSLDANLLRPSKRAYPSCTDAEFAFIMKELHEYGISFTNLQPDRPREQYYGKLADDLRPVPKINLRARELAQSFTKHIESYYGELLNEKHFNQFYAENNDREIWAWSQPLTQPIRNIAFGLIKGEKITSEQISEFLAVFDNQEIRESLADAEYIEHQEFEQTYSELLNIKVKLAP